jgi:hypothetical protein
MRILAALAIMLAWAVFAAAQAAPEQPSAPPYQPKSAKDKAHSESEYTTLAYMRTAAVAEKLYYRKHNQYAATLATLVGTGSFTRRMANPDRGDYTVNLRAKTDGFALCLVPRQFDAEHRSFFIDETGQFRVDDAKRATESSPPLE